MISKKFCPRCGSEDIEMIAGGTVGTFMCKSCGYSGSLFPEKEIFGKEQKVGKVKKDFKKK